MQAVFTSCSGDALFHAVAINLAMCLFCSVYHFKISTRRICFTSAISKTFAIVLSSCSELFVWLRGILIRCGVQFEDSLGFLARLWLALIWCDFGNHWWLFEATTHDKNPMLLPFCAFQLVNKNHFCATASSVKGQHRLCVQNLFKTWAAKC